MMSMKILKDDKKTTLKKYNRSDLIYNRRYSFYKHINIEKFDKLFIKSKYSYLHDVFNLDKFSRLKTQKEKTKEKSL